MSKDVVDTFAMRARILPVVIVGFPLLALAMVPSGFVDEWQRWWALAGFALTFLAAQVGRDRGKAKEPAMWESWGGPPTVQMMRWARLADHVAVAHRHRVVQAVVGNDLQLPSAEDELADPFMADNVYKRATAVILGRTRDPEKFGLLRSENINYNFRRNIVGLRPYGLAAAAAVLLACVALVVFRNGGIVERMSTLAVPALVSAVALVCWFRASPSWVRLAANAYADRLFEAADVLAGELSHADDAGAERR